MQRKGYLIRFIDIGLIILFGFLMISDLTIISQIELPGKSDEQQETPPENRILLGLTINSEGGFSIKNMDDEKVLYTDIMAFEELEFILTTLSGQHKQDGNTLSIYIEPMAEAPMQSLVDVLDVCERLNLSKNINTEAVVAALNG